MNERTETIENISKVLDEFRAGVIYFIWCHLPFARLPCKHEEPAIHAAHTFDRSASSNPINCCPVTGFASRLDRLRCCAMEYT